LNENQKRLEEDNKRLAGIIQQVARTESQPIVVQQEAVDPNDKGAVLKNAIKGIDINKVFALIEKFIPSTPAPANETQAIMNNKEMLEMWKDDFKERMALDRAKRAADIESLTLDNHLKKKRVDGEIL